MPCSAKWLQNTARRIPMGVGAAHGACCDSCAYGGICACEPGPHRPAHDALKPWWKTAGHCCEDCAGGGTCKSVASTGPHDPPHHHGHDGGPVPSWKAAGHCCESCAHGGPCEGCGEKKENCPFGTCPLEGVGARRGIGRARPAPQPARRKLLPSSPRGIGVSWASDPSLGYNFNLSGDAASTRPHGLQYAWRHGIAPRTRREHARWLTETGYMTRQVGFNSTCRGCPEFGPYRVRGADYMWRMPYGSWGDLGPSGIQAEPPPPNGSGIGGWAPQVTQHHVSRIPPMRRKMLRRAGPGPTLTSRSPAMTLKGWRWNRRRIPAWYWQGWQFPSNAGLAGHGIAGSVLPIGAPVHRRRW